ncbi:MAG: antibiotic biosynthesis monooxygenase [Acidobacteriota bacterium]
MLTHSLVVKIVAKENRAEDVAAFLAGALALAEAEEFTPVWFALRENATTFYITDAFSSAEDRQKHVEGEIAKALFASADELLAEPPSIASVEVMAYKLP